VYKIDTKDISNVVTCIHSQTKGKEVMGLFLTAKKESYVILLQVDHAGLITLKVGISLENMIYHH